MTYFILDAAGEPVEATREEWVRWFGVSFDARVIDRTEVGDGTEVSTVFLTIDRQRREVRLHDSELTIRTKEFDLLAALAENAGIVLTREQLLDRVWGYNFYGETRTVDVHVQHVRAKLAGSGLGIMTVRGVGYKLVEDREPQD